MLNQTRFTTLFLVCVVSAVLGIIFGISGLAYKTGYTNEWCKVVNCTCLDSTNCSLGLAHTVFYETQSGGPNQVFKSFQPICPPYYFDCFLSPVNSTYFDLRLREPPSTTLIVLFEFAFIFCGIAILVQVPALILKFLLIETTHESKQEYSKLVPNKDDPAGIHNSL